MYTNHTTVSPISATSTDLTARVLIEACKQQDEQHYAELELTAADKTRRARHWNLVNTTRKFQTGEQVVVFYSARYGITPVATPAVVTYTHNDAIADGKAAGLTDVEARRIVLNAVTAGITADALRTYVTQGIAQRKAELAARRERQAATLARISA